MRKPIGQHSSGRAPAPLTRRPENETSIKVPEITVYFWVVKILTTAMGEAASDYLTHAINPVIAVAIGAIALVACLALQFSVARYIAWVYWLAAAMVSVFGTMAADVLHVGLGVPYAVSTVVFVVALGSIFALWQASEKTLSIHSIYTRRRETFYWATVLATFALGTASGDWTAITLRLGYFSSGLLFAVVIAIPAIAYWRFSLNSILAFWFAYIVTRPLGASFADWMGVKRSAGGLAYGKAHVAVGLTIVIVGFVAYLSVTARDTTRETA